MKWFVAVIIALIVSAVLISGFLAFDLAMLGVVDSWAGAEVMLSAPQRILVFVWTIVKKYSVLIGIFIFPVSLAISLIIAARKK